MGCPKLTYYPNPELRVVHRAEELTYKKSNENARRDYSYSFQGQEADNEIKGQGNSINYKFRMHDPRIGRFLSIDPLAAEYPFYSPYAFSGNRVIDAFELEGLEPVRVSGQFNGQLGHQYGFASTIVPSADPNTWRIGNDGDVNQMQIYWCPTCIGTSGRPGHFMWQRKTWVTNTTTNTAQNTVPGGTNVALGNVNPVATVNGAFAAGTVNPTAATVQAVQAAQNALNAAPAPQTQNGTPQTNTNTVGPVLSNNGQTRTTTTTTTTTQQQQTTTSQNIVTISFSTTGTNPNQLTAGGVPIGQVLNQRFTALWNQLGQPANVVYNPGANQYNIPAATMGGQQNQVMINSATQTTTNTQTVNTTNTTTTTSTFQF